MSFDIFMSKVAVSPEWIDRKVRSTLQTAHAIAGDQGVKNVRDRISKSKLLNNMSSNHNARMTALENSSRFGAKQIKEKADLGRMKQKLNAVRSAAASPIPRKP